MPAKIRHKGYPSLCLWRFPRASATSQTIKAGVAAPAVAAEAEAAATAAARNSLLATCSWFDETRMAAIAIVQSVIGERPLLQTHPTGDL